LLLCAFAPLREILRVLDGVAYGLAGGGVSPLVSVFCSVVVVVSPPGVLTVVSDFVPVVSWLQPTAAIPSKQAADNFSQVLIVEFSRSEECSRGPKRPVSF
jgi:hypothetical protein